MATIVIIAGANTYEIAAKGHYTLALLFGVVVPILALADYWRHRKDPTSNQDRMLVSLMVVLLGYGALSAL